MSLGEIIGCIGIIATLVGFLVYNSLKKQKNKISIKSKNSSITTSDIVGGDKINHGSRKNKE